MSHKRVYVTENSTLYNFILESTVQLFALILTWSTVVHLYTSKYAALQDINCGLKEAASLKSVTQRVYATENSTLKNFN